MSDHARWLHSQITHWVREGLITQETGSLLVERYPASHASNRALSLLTVIGAIIFGLGIILFFAFNWAELSKALKLAVIFGALLLFHGAALLMNTLRQAPSALVEGLYLMGTMTFGAGIWLIAQLYHMDEHYPTAFLLWGVGALAFAWAVPSIYQALLACLLLSVWGVSEVADFHRLHVYSIVLVALGILPLAWMQRSAVLLFLGLLSTFGLLLLNINSQLNATVVFYGVVSLALLLIAFSYMADNTDFPGSGDVLRLLGAPVYAICLFLATFIEVSRVMHTNLGLLDDLPAITVQLTWVLMLLVSLLWASIVLVGLMKRKTRPTHTTTRVHHALMMLSISLLLLQAAGYLNPSSEDTSAWRVAVLLYNAILVTHCVLLIIRGTDDLHWKPVAVGCIGLSGLLFARFHDLFQSLLARSAVFLFLGAMLFVVGHWYARKRTRLQQPPVVDHA